MAASIFLTTCIWERVPSIGAGQPHSGAFAPRFAPQRLASRLNCFLALRLTHDTVPLSQQADQEERPFTRSLRGFFEADDRNCSASCTMRSCTAPLRNAGEGRSRIRFTE